MVGTILPMVYGNTHRTKYTRKPSVLVLYVIGCLTGSIATGLSLAMLGLLTQAFRPVSGGGYSIVLAIVGILALVYGCHEFELMRAPAPQLRWQVPEQWRSQFAPSVVGLFYGLGLGPGLFTAITSASFYVLVFWVIVQRNLIGGAAVFGVYGLGRVSLLVLMYARFNQNRELFKFSRELHRWKPLVHILNGLALSVVSGALIITAFIAFG